MTRISEPVTLYQGIAPDVVWDGQKGDLAVAAPDDAANPAGLLANAPLYTAITLSLFSDAKIPPDPLDPANVDLRGWPGDGFDVQAQAGEAPLGSKFWEAYRYPVNAENARRIERAGREALQPLITQGILGSVEVVATPRRAEGWFDIAYTLKSVAGTTLYSGPFAGLWQGLR